MKKLLIILCAILCVSCVEEKTTEDYINDILWHKISQSCIEAGYDDYEQSNDVADVFKYFSPMWISNLEYSTDIIFEKRIYIYNCSFNLHREIYRGAKIETFEGTALVIHTPNAPYYVVEWDIKKAETETIGDFDYYE